MTKPANDPHKPSPSDTPTDRPDDNGGKAVKKESDKQYHADSVDYGNVDKQHREDEEPVNPIKTPPTEDEGMKRGKVQPG